MKFVLAVVGVVLTVSLAACSEDRPAVCSSVDDLKSSVDDVKGIDVASSAGRSELQSALTAIENDLADVKSDATAEWASQVDAVEASYAVLTSSVESAQGDATADTLTAAGAALSKFGTDVKSLVSDVQATC